MMKVTNISDNAFRSFTEQRRQLEIQTSNNKPQEAKNKKLVAAASLAGAILPLAIYNIKKGNMKGVKDVFEKGGTTEKIKAATGFLEVKDLAQIGISITGSLLAGLGIGLASDKTPENKTAKYKETIYEFMNGMIPMVIIAEVEKILEHKNIKPNLLGKAAMVVGGVGSGMLISNKVSNAVNKKIFKEENNEPERKMKLSDCLVHMDDILGVAVLTGVPFAKHLGKVLPFIYSHVGYETGTRTAHSE